MSTKKIHQRIFQISDSPLIITENINVAGHMEEQITISFKKIESDFESFCDSLELQKDDVILINSEMLINESSKHSNLMGVLFLKWLRIYKRCLNKIIISGFLPLQDIIESSPEHVILMAKGPTYFQYPFSIVELEQAIQNTSVIKEDELVALYRPFVKADFNIDQIAHSFANEFGLFLMLLVHEDVSSVKIEYDHFRSESALNFEKAIFLYFSDINKHKLNNDQEELIEKLLAITVDAPSPPPKILYIDDQAELGWNKLFAGMIFNDQKNKNLITISGDNVLNELEIITKINKVKPSCILLDLRLKGDEEDKCSIEDISGFRILLCIKKNYPSIPIIITSATNKAENLSALLNAGAEGLWTKPRVETIHTPTQLYGFYFNLLELVYNALTKFKTPLEKTIFDIDFHINQLPDNYSHENLENSLFVFDTNYFICNEKNYYNFFKRIKAYLTLHNLLKEKEFKNRIIVVDDVLSELNRLAIGAIKWESEDVTEIKLSAKYSKNLISDFMDSGSGVMCFDYFWEKSLKNEHITYEIIEENNISLYKQQNVLLERFQNLQEANDEKEKLVALNKKTVLHADDTLKFIVSNLFLNVNKNSKIDNIYFVSNDLGCNYNVYRYIINNKYYKFFNIEKPPFIWQKHERNNLSKAAIYFKHHKSRERRLFICESSQFITTFENFS